MNTKIVFAALVSWCFGFCVNAYAAAEGALASRPVAFERVLLEINGSRLMWDPPQPLQLVKGDLLTVLDAWVFQGASVKVDSIDIVGFASKAKLASKDDRNFVINTAQDLQSSFAVDDAKSKYEIKGLLNGQIVASALFELIAPRLDRVDITINGSKKSLRDGDYLDLRGSDRLSVVSILTNVRGNENVTHELRNIAEIPQKKSKRGDQIGGQGANQPKDVGNGRIQKKNKELVFARNGDVFGRIPIIWQE